MGQYAIMEGLSIYNATKAAKCSFARTWTVELKHRKIRVNAVSPGSIDTPIFNPVMRKEEYEQFKNNVNKAIPMSRMGDPDEVAKAVSFLASYDSSYITGIELFVDGAIA
jgi:NAD(P)-dependent dehydrogenase (short-subunit alcohol dehydrogenase family)